MNLKAAIFEALESLSANKVRTGLTILGIVIGVAAVIAMLAVGTGAQNTITGAINGVGTNLLFVFPGNQQQEVKNIQPLTQGDVNAISDSLQAPSVALVAPVIMSSFDITFSGEQTNSQVSGITPAHESVRNDKLTEGVFISDQDLLGHASVALIGPDVGDKLFGRTDGLVGETIRIAGQPFRIIGVLESRGGGMGGSQDNVVYIPLTTAQSRLIHRNNNKYDIVFAQAVSPDQVTSASDEVSQILRTRHRTEIGVDDFTVMTQQDIVSTAQTITGVLTIFLGGIAAISLLVGGIGIMNIMLVSVTERTREIGLRKAIGARKRDILIQFLTESALLSLLGGIIGIAFGWLIGFAVGKVAAASGSPFTPAVSLDAILLATIFATAVGLFFGIYPANRAANLEPVEALRYE
jgi:putative ABC transport system permease protein